MPFLYSIQNTFARVLPEKKDSMPMRASLTGLTGGIGSGGMMPFQDEMIVSKPAIIFHASQTFFNFLAMCCFASVASFQAKWKVGPSGLTGFAIFVAVTGIVFPLFLLFVPVIYEKYNKGARLARAMSELRVAFISTGTGTTISFLIAFITTISAWTEPGCKNASKDPHASLGSTFQSGLDGWCSTKKAGAVFFWLASGFWAASLGLTIYNWRNGKTNRPRDPPFTVPIDMADGDAHMDADDYADEESQYHQPSRKSTAESGGFQSPFEDNNSYIPPVAPYASEPVAAPRPSMDAYGAFSDPAPTGFGAGSGAATPPRVSRTMQYADPYAAVRATVQGASSPARVSPTRVAPPGYQPYNGYQ